MTRDVAEDGCRTEVWIAMAEHFLDTETRHEIPLTALRCVQAGLSADQARDIWNHEVAPAVGANLRSVAGEWAGWDRAWLIDAIRRKRGRRPGVVKRLFDIVMAAPMRDVRTAIERGIAVLGGAAAEDRERLARDLATLARHAFDFVPEPLAVLEPAAHARLAALYPEPFTSLIAPAWLPDEAAAGHRRVEAALQQRGTP